ncbi:hypothetical protein P280DRAFT_466699 [Massarina eburnea CBS 473.64]|uniref:Uncharacterized protein n=1 Tax=Massarina eburnea CBS 473.64 TaxID=1395130 RepID=A0A6A6S9U6_9PLEO|nr:hypothetical protein P280DRAFT_466699 [Massarina eburnea CBS 473.64]
MFGPSSRPPPVAPSTAQKSRRMRPPSPTAARENAKPRDLLRPSCEDFETAANALYCHTNARDGPASMRACSRRCGGRIDGRMVPLSPLAGAPTTYHPHCHGMFQTWPPAATSLEVGRAEAAGYFLSALSASLWAALSVHAGQRPSMAAGSFTDKPNSWVP